RVKKLLAWSGYPGMKVLQFAFDSDENPDLPKNHTANCVVYTGTHDNNTTLGWWENASKDTRSRARKLLGIPEDSDDILPYMLTAAFASPADTAIVPMQDLMGLGSPARMNYPGSIGGNWLWRVQGADYAAIARRLRRLNRMSGRGTIRNADAEALISRAEEICMADAHTSLEKASTVQLHDAVAKASMIEIASQWVDDYEAHLDSRRAVYLSAEYLMGRLVFNNLYAMGLLEDVSRLMAQRGIDLAEMEDIEDAALGNGCLGRLAACFLDSAATHDIPLDGYGLRYRYGLFRQSFDENGAQCEDPDDWTMFGDPWSVRRDDLAQLVSMKGLDVWAVPYDMPIIGYRRRSIGTLRLWQCESVNEFDFDLFNAQDYRAASRDKNAAEDITKVLYPNDTLKAGKLLRLRQQYVLVSASLQDMMRSCRMRGKDLTDFSDALAIQLNDTHPAMAIPELIRLLMNEGMSFAQAFEIAEKTFRYTNHTVMREALECWDMKLMNELSPELVRVIRMIQARLNRELKKAKITDTAPFAIIDAQKRVHMANLSVYGSSYTNGVAAIHSQILKDDVFSQWFALYPERFNNKTNGITQRRWLGLCNPELTALLKKALGNDGFLTDLYRLEDLAPLIDDTLAAEFMAVKEEKKRQLSRLILEREGVEIPPHFVFDVQVKRLHEYKRQLLNALGILDIYYALKDGSLRDFQPTAFIFGAKSAPGYARAKAVIRFINHIAALVNADPDTNDRLRVVFVENYNCSWAEHIIPAADISEQISPAGTEASGTGNMKLMLNGAVTLGTYDGANVEIFEQAGIENNFVFGATVSEINRLRETYDPKALYEADPRLHRVIDTLGDGTFEPADAPLREGELTELKNALLEGASWHRPDHYFLLLDYRSYMEARLKAIRAAGDRLGFAKMCLRNIAGAGKFSSDRTIRQYWDELWRKP
ncbi:MAG: 4-alpha-glucanotransferase, partial [Clostridia bacterium]|nr:4-alpha-glucanotransferase [Clostridia bacterium]